MLTLIAPECCIPAALTVCALSTDGEVKSFTPNCALALEQRGERTEDTAQCGSHSRSEATGRRGQCAQATRWKTSSAKSVDLPGRQWKASQPRQSRAARHHSSTLSFVRSAGSQKRSTSRKRIYLSAIIPFPHGTVGTLSATDWQPTCTRSAGTKLSRQSCGTATWGGLTMDVYVKSVSESQVNAMDVLSEKLGMCNDLATSQTKRIQ